MWTNIVHNHIFHVDVCWGIVHILFSIFVRCRATYIRAKAVSSPQSHNIRMSSAHYNRDEMVG
jgi:hypothetical protein